MNKILNFILIFCVLCILQTITFAQKDNPPLPQPQGPLPPPGFPIGAPYQFFIVFIFGIALAFIIFNKLNRPSLNIKCN